MTCLSSPGCPADGDEDHAYPEHTPHIAVARAETCETWAKPKIRARPTVSVRRHGGFPPIVTHAARPPG
jgi:hypothetical protein